MNKTTFKYQTVKTIELGSCAFRQWKSYDTHCSKIHGYQLKAKFTVSGDALDHRNWIFDFADFKDIKSRLQSQFDHTLCVAKDDPALHIFQQLHTFGACNLKVMDAVGIEKTAEFCFNVADNYIRTKTNNRCWVDKVEVFEHENNSASFGVDSQQEKDWSNNPQPYSDLHTQMILPLTTTSIDLLINQSPTISETIPPGFHSNAAPVAQAPSSGLGGLFAGTRLG